MWQLILLITAGVFIFWVLVDDFMPRSSNQKSGNKSGGGIFRLFALPLLLLLLILQGAAHVAGMGFRLLLPLLSALGLLLHEAKNTLWSLLRTALLIIRPFLRRTFQFLSRILGMLFRSIRSLLRITFALIRNALIRPIATFLRTVARLVLSVLRRLFAGGLRGALASLHALGRSLLSTLFRLVKTGIRGLWAFLRSPLRSLLALLRILGRGMRRLLSLAFNFSVLRLLGNAWHFARKVFSGLARLLLPFLRSLISAVRQARRWLGTVLKPFRSMMNAGFRIASVVFHALPSPLRRILTGIWNALREWFHILLNALRNVMRLFLIPLSTLIGLRFFSRKERNAVDTEQGSTDTEDANISTLVFWPLLLGRHRSSKEQSQHLHHTKATEAEAFIAGATHDSVQEQSRHPQHLRSQQETLTQSEEAGQATTPETTNEASHGDNPSLWEHMQDIGWKTRSRLAHVRTS